MAMAQRYGKHIQVQMRAGMPASFRLHGVYYPIVEVLSVWHLRDRWWGLAPTIHVPPTGERHYYRVRSADQRVFDLYLDAVSSLWVLDVAHG
jgi:hypothetical protein